MVRSFLKYKCLILYCFKHTKCAHHNTRLPFEYYCHGSEVVDSLNCKTVLKLQGKGYESLENCKLTLLPHST